jgi:hypothetical protein
MVVIQKKLRLVGLQTDERCAGGCLIFVGDCWQDWNLRPRAPDRPEQRRRGSRRKVSNGAPRRSPPSRHRISGYRCTNRSKIAGTDIPGAALSALLGLDQGHLEKCLLATLHAMQIVGHGLARGIARDLDGDLDTFRRRAAVLDVADVATGISTIRSSNTDYHEGAYRLGGAGVSFQSARREEDCSECGIRDLPPGRSVAPGSCGKQVPGVRAVGLKVVRLHRSACW